METSDACFVIMPYGKKPDGNGNEIDFDEVYEAAIVKAVEAARLTPIRCDKIEEAGSIHRDMFEHIFQDPVAIVDITTLNANVFYELGARHALKDSVTVLIRRRDVEPPFNIQGLRVISYPGQDGGYQETIDTIKRFIENGLNQAHKEHVDSPIREVLNHLRAQDKSNPIKDLQTFAYRLKTDPRRQIAVMTGDIRERSGIDVWVNSENTYMLMARFFDRSLSAVIRYLGARKNEFDEVIEDTIAKELAAAKGTEREVVPPGAVLVTSAGALAETHKVKKIFHVAAVQPNQVGDGWKAVDNVDRCVATCLRKADALRDDDLRSIVFPMLGTGAGGLNVYEIAPLLLQQVVSYFILNPQCTVERVNFLAWNGRDLEACMHALDDRDEIEKVPGP